MKLGRRTVVIDWLMIPVKYIKILFLVIIIIIAVIVYYLYFSGTSPQTGEKTPELPPGESTAVFVTINGDVQVKKADLYVWKPADYRVDLREGDLIRTAPDAHARIKFMDGTIADISSDSMVRVEKEKTIEKTKQIVTNLEVGEIQIQVPEEKKDDSNVKSGDMRGHIKSGSEVSVRSNPEQNSQNVEVHKGPGIDVETSKEKVHIGFLEAVKVEKDKIKEKIKLPPAPNPKLPVSGSIHEFKRPDYVEIQFEWYDIEAAKSYRFYISQANSPFLVDKLLKEVKDNTIILHIPSQTRAKYLWAVSAVDANKVEGPKSPIWAFTVQKTIDTANVRKEPPVLKITDVEPYIPFLNIKGLTDVNATITVNGESVDVNSEGKFDYFYRLRTAGKNIITIVAEDQAGLKTEKIIERTIN